MSAASRKRTRAHVRGLAAVLALVVVLSVTGGGGGGVMAADGCPEPNDTAEQACELRRVVHL